MDRDFTILEDFIDIALMNDTNYNSMLESAQAAIDDGVESPYLFQETVEDIFTEQEDKCKGELCSNDAVKSAYTPVDDKADDILDAYYSIGNVTSDDIGEMIDHLTTNK